MAHYFKKNSIVMIDKIGYCFDANKISSDIVQISGLEKIKRLPEHVKSKYIGQFHSNYLRIRITRRNNSKSEI